MGEDLKQQLISSEAATLKAYRRRMLLVAFGILVVSVLVGLGFSFYQWDRGSPFDLSTWEDAYANPVARATYGPVMFTLYVFPVMLPFLLVLALPIYFGLKKQSRWPLAVLSFLALGVFWVLWIRGLWVMD